MYSLYKFKVGSNLITNNSVRFLVNGIIDFGPPIGQSNIMLKMFSCIIYSQWRTYRGESGINLPPKLEKIVTEENNIITILQFSRCDNGLVSLTQITITHS